MDNILRYFINEPEREFHVRQLAKLLKKSPTTISKYLKELGRNGLLISKRRHNHLFFRANTESKHFKERKLFFNIRLLRDSGLIEFLEETFNHPQAIVLFGSFGKADNIKESDVDILVITPIKEDVNLKKYEKKLGHKIQLFLHSTEEIEKMKTKNKELLNNFINGRILEGFWEVIK